MFNNLISKSVIRDNIHILIPKNLINIDILILISHGSGGIGAAEYNISEHFLKAGYQVGLLDYFAKHKIENLWWNYEERFRDDHRVSFETMLTDIVFPHKYKIVHIGFSLGGFLGILNSEKFIKNYCFYPGIIGFTQEHISKDYSNTTVYVSKKDEWCDYEPFEKNCTMPPKKIIKDTFHGYMIPNKDTEIPIAKYNLPNKIISKTEFYNMKPCHRWLAHNYGYKEKIIRLQYDKESCIISVNEILEDIKCI
jgi:hypothetical protein